MDGFEGKLGGSILEDGTVQDEVDVEKGGVVEIPAAPSISDIEDPSNPVGSVILDIRRIFESN